MTNALLGLFCGIFLSPWVTIATCCVIGVFYRPDDSETFFKIVVTACTVVCGIAGMVFGIRWGGNRLEGRTKRRAFATIIGGILGIPCGILLAFPTGIPKYVIITVPVCFFGGILLGAMFYEPEPLNPGDKPSGNETGKLMEKQNQHTGDNQR